MSERGRAAGNGKGQYPLYPGETGRDKEKLTRPLFNNVGPIGRLEAYQFIDEEGERGGISTVSN